MSKASGNFKNKNKNKNKNPIIFYIGNEEKIEK